MSQTENAAYATQGKPLRKQIEALLKAAPKREIPGVVHAVIVPDANLMSGGATAAEVYRTLEGRRYDTIILIAPSHSGAFERITICSIDEYQTPLGSVKVHDKMRNELCDEDDDIFLDDTGHFHPDGIDVQLPFLQTVLPPFDIVPIVMGAETPELCKELGHAVGEVMYNRRTLVVACANVVEASEEALKELRTALEALDVSRLMTLFNSERVLMKGKGAVLVAVIAALHRRANHAEILRIQPPEDGSPGFVGAVISRS